MQLARARPLDWRWLGPRVVLVLVAIVCVVQLVEVWRDWSTRGGGADWRNLVRGTTGNPFDTPGWRWSPVAASIMGVIAPMGLTAWRLLHFVPLVFLRPRWLVVLVLLAWPFWRDVLGGNVMTFVAITALLAVRGSRPAIVLYFALFVLIPRPIMLPPLAWLLWRERWSWPWFAAIFIVHAGLVAMSGYGPDWIARLLETGGDEMSRRLNWLPSRFIGMAWVPVGVALAAWLTVKGRLGLASVVISPYLLGNYWLMLLLEARPLARASPSDRPR